MYRLTSQTIAVAALLAGACAVAHAETRVELGLGRAVATARPDGNWYQERFEHHLDLHSDAITLGVRTDLSPRLALHGGAFYIGQNHSWAKAVTHDDLYAPGSPTGCRGECPQLATFIGHGQVWGVRGLLEAHTQGKWQFGVLAGPIIYRAAWTETVPDWFPTQPVGADGYTQGALHPLHLKHASWNLSGAAGVRVARGQVFAELMWYADGASVSRGTYFPGIWKAHTTLTLGWQF